MARRSLWRRFRRATRGPRNAFLAHAFMAIGRVIGALPVSLGLALGRALGTAAYPLLGTPRRFGLEHLAIAFPELSPAARRSVLRSTFRHAGQSFVELCLWPKLALRPDYVAVEGIEAVSAALAQGRGLLAVAGHVGNWELLAATMAARGYPITVVARRVHETRFHALIARFRTGAGLEVLLRDDPAFLGTVRDALRRNRIVALLVDQDTGHGAGVFVPFFGRLARTPPGAALIALRTRAPIVTAFIERRAEGGHLIRVRPVPLAGRRGRGEVTALTAALTAAIEAQIRRAPAEWVWWHERWRRQPGGALDAPRAARVHDATALRRGALRGSSGALARQES